MHRVGEQHGLVTGVTSLAPELATKRLALLKEAFPKIARVAVRIVGSVVHKCIIIIIRNDFNY
jgi:hypothetical protein